MEQLESFKSHPVVNDRITDSRARFVYGVAISSYVALKMTFGISFEMNELKQEISKMVDVAVQETQETESNIFRNKFFSDAMTMIDIPIGNSRKLAMSGWAVIDEKEGRHAVAYAGHPNARRYIYFASSEFYTEYEQWCASRRKTPDIQLQNIRKELSKQPYFIRNHKTPRVWRFSLNNDTARTWWILDYNMMTPAEQNIFLSIVDPLGEEAEQVNDLVGAF
jgi:hypothetical protein